MARIYVASSWRNERQPAVVDALRVEGHSVYDFRHPGPGDDGFHWSEVDGGWKTWSLEQYRTALQHPVAQLGYRRDRDAMEWADTCVLVLPCGRSAHLEGGYFDGAGKRLIILLDERGFEPELMYLGAASICVSMDEVLEELRKGA